MHVRADTTPRPTTVMTEQQQHPKSKADDPVGNSSSNHNNSNNNYNSSSNENNNMNNSNSDIGSENHDRKAFERSLSSAAVPPIAPSMSAGEPIADKRATEEGPSSSSSSASDPLFREIGINLRCPNAEEDDAGWLFTDPVAMSVDDCYALCAERSGCRFFTYLPGPHRRCRGCDIEYGSDLMHEDRSRAFRVYDYNGVGGDAVVLGTVSAAAVSETTTTPPAVAEKSSSSSSPQTNQDPLVDFEFHSHDGEDEPPSFGSETFVPSDADATTTSKRTSSIGASTAGAFSFRGGDESVVDTAPAVVDGGGGSPVMYLAIGLVLGAVLATLAVSTLRMKRVSLRWSPRRRRRRRTTRKDHHLGDDFRSRWWMIPSSRRKKAKTPLSPVRVPRDVLLGQYDCHDQITRAGAIHGFLAEYKCRLDDNDILDVDELSMLAGSSGDDQSTRSESYSDYDDDNDDDDEYYYDDDDDADDDRVFRGVNDGDNDRYDDEYDDRVFRGVGGLRHDPEEGIVEMREDDDEDSDIYDDIDDVMDGQDFLDISASSFASDDPFSPIGTRPFD